ncbi:3-isopropylmalate dehydrogenase [Lentilactobacillus otakiensis]|uniref:3-isopropylmalate dehydrogenase n=1 Tax=Lentilactobacillus otakiensis DSM 19908 = JCM 15040 TaxID=1423780 RepID=S4NDW5_9LACO|nr:3-isopropylmalate dehydrogenase [Lentilactobacillus otakiensis]KRL12040.1 3-isopropylmalate dehydrogenase [Lentilactobacillus otakiensis DSM 19908 = JCM 15040]MBZ3776527.1 3-isopropylmalate dehydrogenase [Lentilactobacillus otakiensis]MDV3517376.1 3-isopropylmalate dehydrogenase [Lentilactobacillus otakiensis]GAD17074.1 3-isopropylmalate dehydrogenase [Lentilactobacillus otakiensis DSM 19908 = JCM 15040]
MANKQANITVLQGDYIGPEIMKAGLAVLKAVSSEGFNYQLNFAPFGGEAIDQFGAPLPDSTLDAASSADAILLAAVGGPKWDDNPERPENGLLQLRKKLNLFANIRPTEITADAMKYSPLKIYQPVDFVIVRELTSGIYFGKPRELANDGAFDTMRYTRSEIERVAKIAFDMAVQRRQHVTLVDKSNVLATSKLWEKVFHEVARGYPNVEVDRLYVDAAAMKLISVPNQFDVILTENLFGDILSDEAAEITGSLGTIPSMSKGAGGPVLYEPIHGSAPDIAGKGIADPLSMIRCVAMMLKYSFNRSDLSQQILDSVDAVASQGINTPDRGGDSSTQQVTNKIIDRLQKNTKYSRYIKNK